MFSIFQEALIDSAKMLPLLLVIYIGIELLEYKFGNLIREKVQKAGNAGPAIGALVGSLPQCGFSVIATALYTQKLLTIGTLLAVYISTSDEAVPIILSQPDKVGIIIPIIFTKIILALIAGYSVDYLFRKLNKKTLVHIEAFAAGTDDIHHHHESIIDEKACCNHEYNSKSKNFEIKQIIIHPVIHTVKIFLFIFLVSFLINFIIYKIGLENFGKLFLENSIFQPVLAGLVGLIPNCAASVAITKLYLGGILSFGSVITGLSTSAGLGILVLFRENNDVKDTFKVLGLLFGISTFAGIIIQFATNYL